ncbi:MAG: glutamine-hydrolyzing carbamoyl-phosphate synthase small subunit [Deltaproteobacteria bacterium]|nr:MAG: glutamine-hydrolyzing carbamoyl-phosphate synthase small subunit [Deltaproteobacteria bacterium]
MNAGGARAARARRRRGFPRPGLRCTRRGRGRARLQHQHDGLPGDPDRSLLRGTARRHDLPGDRQRRREPGGRRVAPSLVDLDPKRLVRRAKESPGLIGRDLVRDVTCAEPYEWTEGPWQLGRGYASAEEAAAARERPPFRVVAYDFGIKHNILRNLVGAGCQVRVVPAATPAREVLALRPDGVFLSNGPGDPDAVTGARETVAELLGEVPVFGICLGHQIMGLALGGRTYKLKFGHHGGNQPVQDLTTGKVEITAQNHGFAVDPESLRGRAEVTHLNLNDRTVEGLAVKGQPTFSVQYHPEASPGPHDARYLFRRFTELMERTRR